MFLKIRKVRLDWHKYIWICAAIVRLEPTTSGLSSLGGKNEQILCIVKRCKLVA